MQARSAMALVFCLSTTLFWLHGTSCAEPASRFGYAMSGSDQYEVGSYHTSTTFRGEQALTVTQRGGEKTFAVSVRYVRINGSDKHAATAAFAQREAGGGAVVDFSDQDPDYVSILSQPLSIELSSSDVATLASLRERVPMEFPSKIGEGELTGYFAPAAPAQGGDLVGVHFAARGKMAGPLPGHEEAFATGIVSLKGTAFYSVRSGRLVAIESSIRLDGNLEAHGDLIPVHIAFERCLVPLLLKTFPSKNVSLAHASNGHRFDVDNLRTPRNSSVHAGSGRAAGD